MVVSSRERAELEYKQLSDRFINFNVDFQKQFCSIYVKRLERMTHVFEERIKGKWGDEYPICKLHKLAEEDIPKCIVVGTIFKDQKLKPSVLKKLAEANSLVPQPIVTHFTDDSDTLYIEDEIQRFEMEGVLDKNKLVTGISIAVLCTDQGKGKLLVHDYCFAGFQTQVERPLLTEDYFVVFVSGLDLIHHEKSVLSLQFFTQWLTGILGDINNIKSRSIVRLVIAGNSVRTQPNKDKATISLVSRTEESNDNIEAVKSFDDILHQIAQVMEVDVMPGEYDPSNHVLPQKPMHLCLFPNAGKYKSLNLMSNPYECNIGGINLLGTSGQTIKDIMRFSEIVDPLEAMEECLKWGHVAPTAPDTLGCYPLTESDPFVIENCPHVMFAGNQKAFDTRMVEGESGQKVRLISIPKFSSTFTACVLNLKNLACVPVSFYE